MSKRRTESAPQTAGQRGAGVDPMRRRFLAEASAAGALTLAALPAGGRARGTRRIATAPASSTIAVPAAVRRPHIVLLTIDALSAQHMSLYGYSRPTTPQLSEFARSATIFDRAYANANFTTPGISTILTGTRAWTHRALQLPVWPLQGARVASFPAMLKRAGYRLGYVSTNPHAGADTLGFGGYFQFARTDRIAGLTVCRDGLSARLRFACAAQEMMPFATLDGLLQRLRRPDAGNLEHDPRLAIDPALRWLATVDRSRPIFLWVHLFPPHSPYAAPEPWLGRFDPSPLGRTAAQTQPTWAWQLSRLPAARVQLAAARYDESLACSDYYAGEFLRRAVALLGPDTAVVITADHGESFSHGYGAHTGPGLYDELIRIPLIIKLPGQTAPRRCATLAQQIDIAPTLAAVAGCTPPPSWSGQSLLGSCTGAACAAAAGEATVFSMNFEQNPRLGALRTGSVAAIEGRWKLIHYMGALHYPDMPALHDELYDIVADEHERNDLAASNAPVVRRLRTLIGEQLARHGTPVARGRGARPPDAHAAPA